ncbi:tRNA-specific adenosine deaminase [Candidatus Fermentibacteria bacterium]|nr:MAG: tRNA-specific adenosine deaminase [Candidatus Fermentibacteria bacterium]
MKIALEEARKAFFRGEVPVGAVLVTGDGTVYRNSNRTGERHLPDSHAECLVIKAACAARNDWRLEDCTLYATLEPCVMCAGVILISRIARVVYGAWDKRFGAFGSVTDLLEMKYLNHYPEVTGGVLADEASALMKRFFRERRLVQKNLL